MRRKIKSRGRDGVKEYLREVKPAHQKIIRRLRSLVRKAVPELHEELKWGNPCYVLGKNENVCGIYVVSDHVNLSFFSGTELNDHKGLLEGTGKRMRHIKLQKLSDIDAKVLTALIQQAALAASK